MFVWSTCYRVLWQCSPGSRQVSAAIGTGRPSMVCLSRGERSGKRLSRPTPWAGVKCILAASNFLALPTPDRAATAQDLSEGGRTQLSC